MHCNDNIMSTMASQITSLTIVYSTVYSGTDQRNYQSPPSLSFVPGIHRLLVNFPHKEPVTRKLFPIDDIIMECVRLKWEDESIHYTLKDRARFLLNDRYFKYHAPISYLISQAWAVLIMPHRILSRFWPLVSRKIPRHFRTHRRADCSEIPWVLFLWVLTGLVNFCRHSNQLS